LDTPTVVAFVSPGWPPDARHNGIVSYTAAIRGALEELRTRVFVLDSWGRSELDEPDVVCLRPNEAPARRSVRQVCAKLMYRLDPHNWHSRVLGAAICRAARELHRQAGLQVLEMEESFGIARHVAPRCPVPVIVRLHGPWFLNGRALGVKEDAAFRRKVAAERKGILLAAGVTAPSADVLDRTRRFHGVSLDRACVIPNPIPPSRAEHRWNSRDCDPNTVLFVGRFDRHKGGDLLIRAFEKVQRLMPQTRLLFVGPDQGCLDVDGRSWHLADAVRDQSGKSLADAGIEWVGAQPASQIVDLRRRAAVTVVCSRYENFPMVALEAMAAGCPLVASGVGGLTELVQHGQNGLLCRPEDPDDLADKIRTLLQNPTLAARLGEQAAQDAAQRYAPEAIARQTLEFYSSVAEQVRPAPRRVRGGGAAG